MGGRSLRVFVLAWLGFGALVLGAAWLASGGWAAWVALDPLNRPYRPAESPVGIKGPYVAWLGDSVCLAQQAWSAEDLGTPSLGELMRHRLCGEGSLLGADWKFLAECRSGTSGPGYELAAKAFCASGAPPRIAVIPVNLRSLNAKGANGFAGPPAPVDAGALARARARPEPWAKRLVKGLGEPGAALRGLAAWGRKTLHDAFSPIGLREERDSRQGGPPSPQETAAGFRRVYGNGFGLDAAVLEALLRSGRLLRQSGCRVFYYLTPVERARFEELMGRQALAGRDQAAERVVAALKAEAFEVLDLQASLREGFYEPPSEHLDARARIWLAERLTAWIGERLHAKPLGR
jgi:hypothetical protein